MYESERLSEDEIDALAINYENDYNNIVSMDEYNAYLKYLDCKNILNDIQNALRITDDRDFATIVFDYLSSKEGAETISNVRNNYFGELV